MNEVWRKLDAGEMAAAAEAGFRSGLNCAQAVVAAFAGECGLDRETAVKAVCGLGGGVGRLREVCGTVTGASVVLSMLAGDGGDKNAVYALVQRFAEKFRQACGSVVCRELLAGTGATAGGTAEARTAEYYRKRPCAELAALSARFIVETLQEQVKEDA